MAEFSKFKAAEMNLEAFGGFWRGKWNVFDPVFGYDVGEYLVHLKWALDHIGGIIGNLFA